mmetsp:Transcript_74702/g.189632  ORF Transcript_74702/g.189632 Transcript_74702/m.189632 type:complete len:208 (+) Transcript_74702:450-1073(+)
MRCGPHRAFNLLHLPAGLLVAEIAGLAAGLDRDLLEVLAVVAAAALDAQHLVFALDLADVTAAAQHFQVVFLALACRRRGQRAWRRRGRRRGPHHHGCGHAHADERLRHEWALRGLLLGFHLCLHLALIRELLLALVLTSEALVLVLDGPVFRLHLRVVVLLDLGPLHHALEEVLSLDPLLLLRHHANFVFVLLHQLQRLIQFDNHC